MTQVTRAANDILLHVPGHFKRVARTHGGEWAGPCPWCHGRDRFRVWPYREPTEDHSSIVYWCRGCGACGDLIQFLRDYKGLSFVEACNVSGQEPRGKRGNAALNLLRSRRVVYTLEPEQLSLLETLNLLYERMRHALTYSRAQAYLATRHIPLHVAQAYSMGYLPPMTDANREVYARDKMLSYWSDSLMTPTRTPSGAIGYTGRKLTLWEPGMDEDMHKSLLQKQHLPRLIKTGNPGWVWRPREIGSCVILVEGKFDVFALVAAGFSPSDVVGVGTNSANVDWLPPHVRTVLVAFNGDTRGRLGAQRVLTELRFAGVEGVNCCPPENNLGTDCSARWRLGGHAALAYLFEAWQRHGQLGEPSLSQSVEMHTHVNNGVSGAGGSGTVTTAEAPVQRPRAYQEEQDVTEPVPPGSMQEVAPSEKAPAILAQQGEWPKKPSVLYRDPQRYSEYAFPPPARVCIRCGTDAWYWSGETWQCERCDVRH